MKNVLLVTGGSGGHVIPAISLLEHLERNFNVKIVSDIRGSKFIDQNNYEYVILDVPHLFSNPYLFPLKLIKYIFNIIKSLNFLKKNKINIVISMGGYMSIPFCIAAYLQKKKIILFEPNSVLGRSNKIILKFSNKIICYDRNLKNFPDKYVSKKITIDPILRNQIYKLRKNSKSNSKKTKKILIIGGSQGASFFDHKITDFIVNISNLFQIEILQQVSDKNMNTLVSKKYEKAKINFKIFNFTNESKNIYDGIDLAITRGGASTLSELSYLNIPFIAIPLPTAKDNHQFYNSNYYYQKNCCWIINQDEFEIGKLSSLISKIFKNDEYYIKKIDHMEKLNEKNTWNNINNRIMEIINEN